MAFGFVVVKFSLFINQISLILGKETVIQQTAYSGIVGIVLVAVGTTTSVLPYIRYKQSARQLNNDNYKHSSLLITVLTSFILLVSILLIAYLVKSI